jgi:hypothetical protein
VHVCATCGAAARGHTDAVPLCTQGRYVHEATHALPIIGDGDTG